MIDLAVRGGRVVMEDGERVADLLIRAERIEAIVAPGDGRAQDEVDARGLVVLPGVVDAHVHVNEPGRAHWEGWLAATRGAAAGGVTTIADMPLNSIPPTIDRPALEAKLAAASRSAIVDFALWGGLVDADADRVRDLHLAGVVGLKAFLCPSGVDEFPHLNESALPSALGAAASAGALVAAHCEDERTVVLGEQQMRRLARRDRSAWLESRPPAAERRAIERLGAAAREAGARVHVVHASSDAAVEATRRARQSGAAITVETCPHYLVFTAEDVDRVGPALKCAPPIRDETSRERLWGHVLSGSVDCIASDHSPCAAELKERGEGDIWEAWGGVSGIQSTLPALLTAGVHRRGLPLVQLALLLATHPARLLGLWPRKGAIRPGADADFAIVDLDREWTLSADELETRSHISPYLGMRFRGAVVRTILRGHTVYAEGRITDAPPRGTFVPRRDA